MKRCASVRLWQPGLRTGPQSLPRILAVHDLCGYGSCSLSTALPVLSTAAVKVCSLPTAYLSAHTAFPRYSFYDTSGSWTECLSAWQDIGLDFAGIYSGFLGNCQQAEVLRRLYHQYPQALRLVDPVMGDQGEIYKTYTPELCQAVRELAREAQIITPNLTEAALLTGLPYPGEEPTEEALEQLIAALLDFGPDYIVLKAGRRGQEVQSYCFGPELDCCRIQAPLVGQAMHGTGDLFASALLAGIFAGKDLERCLQIAMDFVSAAMFSSLQLADWVQAGVSFEQELPYLQELLTAEG